MNARIFIAPDINTTKRVFILDSFFQTTENSNELFCPKYRFQYTFSVVHTIAESNIVLIPQAISKVTEEVKAYVNGVIQMAEGRPVVCFVSGDLSHDVILDGCLVLKGTQFRGRLHPREIIIPPICEDLGAVYGWSVRKKGLKPKVGFCGWAGFSSSLSYTKYLVDIALNVLFGLIKRDPEYAVFRKGLFFRRKSLKALSRSAGIEKNFIIRKTFSGHIKTIGGNTGTFRDEYINNIVQNDFTLAPKGDANYSVRFFEALSLGRIPILVDTHMCLPCEDFVDYDSCIVRVNYKEISKITERVIEMYKKMTEKEFESRQRHAREIFEDYLRYDSFFNRLFSDIAQGRYNGVL